MSNRFIPRAMAIVLAALVEIQSSAPAIGSIDRVHRPSPASRVVSSGALSLQPLWQRLPIIRPSTARPPWLTRETLHRLLRENTPKGLRANIFVAGSAMLAFWIFASDSRRSVDPSDAFNWRNRSEVYRQQKKYAEAMTAIQKAIELSPKSQINYFYLGRIQLGERNFDGAIQSLNQYIALYPKDFGAYHSLGLAYEGDRDPTRAISIYRLGLAHGEFAPPYKNISYGQLFLDLGTVLAQQDNYNEAAKAFSSAARFADLRIDAEERWGDAAFQSGQNDATPLRDALSHYDVVDNALPSAMIMLKIGKVYEALGEPDQAITWYEKALHQDPASEPAKTNLGFVYISTKRFADAESLFRNVLKTDHSSDAHFNLGLALREQKKNDEAAEEFREAIHRDPSSASAYENLGLLLFEAKNLPEAAKNLRTAISLNPKNAETRKSLIAVLEAEGSWSQVEDQYRAAAELDSRNPEIYFQFGQDLSANGRWDDAITAYIRTIQLDPLFIPGYIARSNAYVQLGQRHEALSTFIGALERFPNDVSVLRQTAILLKNAGRARDAVKYSKRAEQLERHPAAPLTSPLPPVEFPIHWRPRQPGRLRLISAAA